MTDERFVFTSDVRERKRTASGARAKKGGSRSKRCTLPSDALSASQKRKLNGSVESISLNSPMSWARLRELAPTLQFLYLDHLVNEHKARRVDLCAMLGVATCTFWKLQQKLPGKLIFNGQSKKPAPEWTRFMEAGYQDVPATGNDAPQEATPAQDTPSVESTPAVLAGSVTVRCTASHVLDALKRLIDDPAQEYTFTVSFTA